MGRRRNDFRSRAPPCGLLLRTCLERPGAHTGEPEYGLLGTPVGHVNPVRQVMVPGCGKGRCIANCWAVHGASSRRCPPNAISTWRLAGSPVVPRNPEIRAGDTESFEGSVRAVRPGHESRRVDVGAPAMGRPGSGRNRDGLRDRLVDVRRLRHGPRPVPGGTGVTAAWRCAGCWGIALSSDGNQRTQLW